MKPCEHDPGTTDNARTRRRAASLGAVSRVRGGSPRIALGVFVLSLGSLLVGCGRSAPNLPDRVEDRPAASSPSKPAAANLLTLTGYVGGEKSEFLRNERIRAILAERYGVALNPTKAGSIEMVTSLDRSGMDFVWPSNDFAVELLRTHVSPGASKGHSTIRKEQIVFNSPIVIYAGWNIANALIREGIVEKRDAGYFIVRLPELLKRITEQKTWKDVGLPFHGKITVRCTDPTRSNSGSMFAGLVSYALNKEEVVDDQSVETVLPEIQKFFARLGFMEHSSGDIFRKFIATGTTNSMVVGYENQIIEFIIANAASRELIENSVCVLYPEPTIWSSHPMVSLTPNGDKLIEALMDGQIQKLAWSDHGFRSGLVGVTIDPSAVSLPFMPESIDSVIPLPGPRAFERLLEGLKSP